ncbi:MAG: glycogen/starch synthase [Bacteroidaceae bacterium]|nr:glycogen/starch synthase [Bacteroidaceae bacterium]MCF0186653.1 glycogen/starch synthase [Bacteroidaceae bacterium]
MKAKKILFITQEIIPYMEACETANSGRALPISAQDHNREVRIFMPKWGVVNERRNQLHEVIRLSGMNLIINDTDHPLIIKVASMQGSRLQVYFIDNDDYFMKRLIDKDENGEEYKDNGERAVFYTRGALETVKKLRWCPDVIVCQGWMGAFVPFYIKTLYREEPSFRDTKVIYLNEAFELTRELGKELLDSIYHKNLPADLLESLRKDQYTYKDILQMASDYSDGVIFGSPHIKEETKELFINSGKPVMEYPGAEDFEENCINFYDKVFSIGKEEQEN